MKLKESKISSKSVYECSFLELFEDEVLLPNNETSKRVYIKHNGGAAVLPITSEGNVILTKQYRYPIGQVSIEIPAGKKDSITELGIDCVTRELEEETGYQSNSFSKFTDIHSCVGYSSEVIELFIASDCFKVDNPKAADDDEFIEVLECSIKDVKRMMDNNEITDAKTLIMLQYYLK